MKHLLKIEARQSFLVRSASDLVPYWQLPYHSNSRHPLQLSTAPQALSGATPNSRLEHRGSCMQAAAAVAAEPATDTTAAPADPIVQYVVLRQDLYGELKWPLGSVVAQACHASCAALWLHRDDETTSKYCAADALDHMHKVVLEVKGETQLRALASKLSEAGILHKLWVEQPEDFPTCLATKPYSKSTVAAFFKKLPLCKTTII